MTDNNSQQQFFDKLTFYKKKRKVRENGKRKRENRKHLPKSIIVIFSSFQ